MELLKLFLEILSRLLLLLLLLLLLFRGLFPRASLRPCLLLFPRLSLRRHIAAAPLAHPELL